MAHLSDTAQHSHNASNEGDTSSLHGTMQTSADATGSNESAVCPPTITGDQPQDDSPRQSSTNTNTKTNANVGTAVPLPILASPAKHQGSAGPTGSAAATGGGNISFSPLPLGRSFPDSQQPPGRRLHDLSPSPARSLAHVLKAAQTVEGARNHAHETGAQEGHRGSWSANSSMPTGSSAVHFVPQRGHNGWRPGFGSTGGGSSAQWIMGGTSVPESRFSEFEVVYDDGVRKQRTFSLTTEPELDDDEERSSSDNDDNEHNPLLGLQDDTPVHSSRVPADGHWGGGYTGMLQDDPAFPPLSSGFAHSTTPLLGKSNSHQSATPSYTRGSRSPPRQPNGGMFSGMVDSIQQKWDGVRLTIPQKRIFKASLAYLLACLISFTPWFKPYIGASGHLAASSAVFFNPAKSLGRMVDAATAGLCAIFFGVVISVASMLSAIWFNQRDLYIWGHVVSVVIFGGGSTFIIAYAKAHYNRPTVNVACILSHIMILVILTKEGALSLGEFNISRVAAITVSMLLGVVISVLVCIFLWPESAHETLRQDMGKSLSSFRLLLKLLTKTFLLEADTSPFGSESVQKLIESQVKSFSALAKSLEEAQLEYPGTDIKKYEECVKSLNTLAQYLNGLRSSCGLQYDMLKKDERRKEDEAMSRPSNGTPAAGTQAGLTGINGKRTLGAGMRMSSYSLLGSLNSDQDQSASVDLMEFLDHVGKPMKSLALTCKLTIEHLQDIFTSTSVDSKTSSSIHGAQRPKGVQRQSDHESGEAFSDSTFDARGTYRSSRTSAAGPGETGTGEGFKKNPSLILMQINLARALDIFEAANSKALKKFYSQQHKRRSGILKRPAGSQHQQQPDLAAVVKRMSEPSFQALLSGSSSSNPTAPAAAESALTEKAPVGEQIFLVYFFVFNLMEFSKELAHLVSCVEVLVDGDEGLDLWVQRNRMPWWRRIWFSLTGFPRRLRRPNPQRDIFESFDTDAEAGLRSPHAHSYPSNGRPHSSTIPSTPTQQSHAAVGQDATNGLSSSRRGHRRKQRLFPKPNIHNKTNTLHTPTPSTTIQRWSTRLWKFLHVFRSFKFKYALKAALSAVVLLIPAFVDWTRPYFVQYRGEWALISMLIIMVPTVGGTNVVGIYRIMGTIVGCYAGVAIYLLFPANEIMLPLCCFLFAVPNFYLVLCSSYPRIGQVTLLAFNLVLIQTYNRRHGDGTVPPDDDDDDDDGLSGRLWSSSLLAPNDPSHISDVWTIAFHRAVAVSIGVVIGVGVTSYIWPYEARVELRKGLSDLLLNMSWLYNRLVSVYSTNLDRVSILPQEDHYQQSRSRIRALLRKTTFQERFQTSAQERGELDNKEEDSTEMDIGRMNREFMAIELSLQLQLLRLYALLEETPNEPRLKGKFPVGTYKNMLGSCQNILDRFLSMRLVITKDQWLESARRDFIVPVNKERREMVGNVLLYFYTIASALRLKTPLPPYLPPANKARLRLIQKIRQLPVVQNKVVLTEESDERYIFYYAYALVMEDVIRELERLGHWSQDLFGVITPAAEFEAWFTEDGYLPGEGPLSPYTVDEDRGDPSSGAGYFRTKGHENPQTFQPSSATRDAPLSPPADVEAPYEHPSGAPRSFSKPLLVTPGKYRYHPNDDQSRRTQQQQQRQPSQQFLTDDGVSTHSADDIHHGSLNDQRSDMFAFDESSVGSGTRSAHGRNPFRDPTPQSSSASLAPRRQESSGTGVGSIPGKRPQGPSKTNSRPSLSSRSQSLHQSDRSISRSDPAEHESIPDEDQNRATPHF
ncbi:hypothetical protein EMPS_09786 [Entomortierella parvispora]|uniref:DUF2421 domain-containing protein n=1 Tax=Entomortierella parvispora TaxID=205924 RepID=A0A9P3HIU1_9FUNG|nr:hypothetical protein EMPS_09786 [Entomortierella parvispora]